MLAAIASYKAANDRLICPSFIFAQVGVMANHISNHG
jgi:hypothetical protein